MSKNIHVCRKVDNIMPTSRLRYFAACNSENGFHSFYPDVFTEDLSRIVIIKGGPGTGKSSLMRRAADRAEARGYTVEEIYCSSDPDSLDGIIARTEQDSLAILDGTAPHVTEMTLPGARDEILYVGDFWSSDQLRPQRDAISRDSRTRSDLYCRLYRYLQAAGQCSRNMEAVAEGIFDPTKLQETVTRILSRYPAGLGFSQRIMLTSSFGMKGAFRFPTFESASDTVIRIRDWGNISHLFFEEVLRQAQRRHMKVWLSYDPLIPTHLDGICLPDCRLAFVRAGASENLEDERESSTTRTLSIKRFMNTDGCRAANPAVLTAQNCRDRLLDAALGTLAAIRDIHFRIESRYVAAMDFPALQTFTDTYLNRILP